MKDYAARIFKRVFQLDVERVLGMDDLWYASTVRPLPRWPLRFPSPPPLSFPAIDCCSAPCVKGTLCASALDSTSRHRLGLPSFPPPLPTVPVDSSPESCLVAYSLTVAAGRFTALCLLSFPSWMWMLHAPLALELSSTGSLTTGADAAVGRRAAQSPSRSSWTSWYPETCTRTLPMLRLSPAPPSCRDSGTCTRFARAWHAHECAGCPTGTMREVGVGIDVAGEDVGRRMLQERKADGQSQQGDAEEGDQRGGDK